MIALLLIALWVRSYSQVDQYFQNAWGKWLVIQSGEGSVLLELTPASEVPQGLEWWGGQTIEIWGAFAPVSELPFFERWFRPFSKDPPGDGVFLPHWFVIAVFATLTAVPWIGQLRWRYSLRTLLIVATLVAVVLGMTAMMLRGR